jgi:8-oxo-dGTP pyrophosphatase MutT (NUDIX family)
MSIETISSDYINRHQYFTARKDAYRLSSGKIVDPYFVVEIPESVTAMAVTVHRKILLISQYRHPIGMQSIELPGGFIDAGENPEVAVRRELLEETGYGFKSIYHLGSTAANPGILNNFTQLYLALDGEKIKEQQLDPNEEIQIMLKSIEEVEEMLHESKFFQSMHSLCLFYGLAKLRELGY